MLHVAYLVLIKLPIKISLCRSSRKLVRNRSVLPRTPHPVADCRTVLRGTELRLFECQERPEIWGFSLFCSETGHGGLVPDCPALRDAVGSRFVPKRCSFSRAHTSLFRTMRSRTLQRLDVSGIGRRVLTLLGGFPGFGMGITLEYAFHSRESALFPS